ncbi:MAG: hypothetical protein WD035_06280 [Balneolaceae bacterium]
MLKLTEFRKLNTLRVLTVNYFVAAGIAFLTTTRFVNPFTEELLIPLPVLLLALLVGIFFITNYFIYSKSVDHNGVGISVAAMRISLLIPVLLSTLWYREYLATGKWAGVVLVFMTLYLLLPNRSKGLLKSFQAGWLLLFIFLLTGFGDASLKIYEADYSGFLSKQQFMGMVYTVSFISGISVVLIREKGTFTRQELLMGTGIGVPNLYSAVFLIDALSGISGGIVYTTTNILTVLGATLLGIWRWNDRLTRTQWAGILLTLIAILLMIG